MATNRMKALYAIMLPKKSNVPGVERTTEEVNEERLNDNFRTITNELVKLWEGGEHNLKVLSARVTSEEQVTASLVEQIGDVAAETRTNTAAIEMVPEQITSAVSEELEGYATTDYVDDSGAAVLAAAKSYSNTKVTQTANELTVEINQNKVFLFGEEDNEDSGLSAWVRVVGAVGTRNPGVIIGNSSIDNSLKAEGGAIFFYRGDEENAWWEDANHVLNPNALAGFDANGNFVTRVIHNDSLLLDEKFDIDVVTANSVDFLHITGRNT